ncbi:MAG: 50S ribosomal protein L9 [Firmicutes bacterium]|nr:50S ribosomal protein L9 [Bacillota bacterium]HOB34763.1 50S ribosomal protein L9 [Bacillota bacterium]HPZ91011.1 50S ribosomal protein L9 [Bacillota bacterium]HQE02040.1 50S ribosomal protein L9 [Bacillota bacterium]
MRVILKAKVKGLGVPGDVKEVSDGYARNFLLPKGLAVVADAAALRKLEQQRQSQSKKEMQELEHCRQLKEQIEAEELKYIAKAGEGGRLFGSVTSNDVAAELARKGIRVDRRKIVLPEPIKSLGKFNVEIRLHSQVTANLTLIVATE